MRMDDNYKIVVNGPDHSLQRLTGKDKNGKDRWNIIGHYANNSSCFKRYIDETIDQADDYKSLVKAVEKLKEQV